MILKEAISYLEYLKGLESELASVLLDPGYIYNTTRINLYSGADPDWSDKKEDLTIYRAINCDADKIVHTLTDCINEENKCTEAIAVAKRKLHRDLDTLVEETKRLQSELGTLNVLLSYRTRSLSSKGTGYRFDIDGKQAAFYFPVLDKQEITYDISEVHARVTKLKKLISENKVWVEHALLETQVDYTAKWETDKLLVDILEG